MAAPVRSAPGPSLRRWVAVLCGGVVLTTSGTLAATAVAQEAPPEEPAAMESGPDEDHGRELFRRDCVYCHGPDGAGTNRGPGIRDRGAAGIDFVLRTGRMPIDDPDQGLDRRTPLYSADEIAAIVAYARSFVDGPDIPDVDVDEDTIAHGGELFRLHCAACHQMVGTGGILIGDRAAPALLATEPIETGEAIRFGPGTMPQYPDDVLSDGDVDAIVTYIDLEIQQATDRGGLPIGHFGPWTEGAVAWFIGVGALLLISLWIGRRT